ncbi:hypothetical protein [Arenibaculum sp.]|uniref:hypothetical protein n=1 Tax=Arenibaculum sp. TaxID=2865862 RepID=UPI002E0E88C0|nr:hypothetical protein [Arenibaculum sp.]
MKRRAGGAAGRSGPDPRPGAGRRAKGRSSSGSRDQSRRSRRSQARSCAQNRPIFVISSSAAIEVAPLMLPVTR